MCLQTALTIASVGLKIAEGVQANRAAKAEAVMHVTCPGIFGPGII